MGDLHSIACSSSSYHTSSLGWEFHNLGVFNADISQLVGNTPPFLSPPDSDFSTGYLQDALFEFNSKRRRLLLFPDDQNKESNDSIKSCWYSNYTQNSSEDLGCQSHMTNLECISGEPMSRNSDDSNFFSEMKTPEGAISASETFDSSSSTPKDSSVNTLSTSDKETLYSLHSMNPSGVGEKRKKRVITKVVYPFALVKPGGTEGDMTLNDINERILMPPTRPVRHPVGDFACRPLVSPDGPGLSGKAVVAFTRIHTHGRGTITIIRTKG